MKISEEQLEQINRSFQRVFALPISRLTLKEIQNALTASVPNKQEEINAIYNSLLSGNLVASLKDDDGELRDLIDTYSYQVRIAKEVAEMGDFMNIFSCDFMNQGNQVFFINRMRRIDGQEYYFLSAAETNVRLAHMFINRLRDLKKQVGKGVQVQMDENLRSELTNIQKDIDDLLS